MCLDELLSVQCFDEECTNFLPLRYCYCKTSSIFLVNNVEASPADFVMFHLMKNSVFANFESFHLLLLLTGLGCTRSLHKGLQQIFVSTCGN
jgi:hypothetical protein